MNNIIKVNDKDYRYRLVRRQNSLKMQLKVYSNGEISVSAPKRGLSLKKIEKFIILSLKKIDPNILNKQKDIFTKRKDYLETKEKARKLILGRLSVYSQKLNLKYNKVSIRDQKTRWGSCSREGNLNFNYRLYNLPLQLCDYIIVHELCHLQEHNHSKNFWFLVSTILPDYKQLRKELKSNFNLD